MMFCAIPPRARAADHREAEPIGEAVKRVLLSIADKQTAPALQAAFASLAIEAGALSPADLANHRGRV